jgi:serine/threonine protein kinase/Tol biopolymer transport system component
MPLSPGDKLGPYEVLAPIGRGGMGEVYRAKDTKLDREVAIKVLPAALAQDPERLARFEREAKVLASLNHPNIAQIYGIQESSMGRALVMELVPGGTLTGTLPLETALNYARQIAEALEAAHDKSIIHRDLKPANIMITPVSTVKVLDFGLAAVTQPSAVGSADPSNSPTLTMGATQAGMILGTAGYMAPEQAAGQAVDKRADIWAFGVVLYEMLAGQRLFTGDSVAHILADVLRAPIDFEKLPVATPRVIRDLLKRCLDRNVKTRLRDIGEARVAIQNVDKEPEETVSTTPTAWQSGRLAWAAAAVLAVIAALAIWAPWRHANPVDRPLIRLDVDLGGDVSLPGTINGGGTSVVISPDGTRLAYASGTPPKLFTRRLDQPRATELPGTQGTIRAFFSPDGQWIGFYGNNKLSKISVEGGAIVPLAETPNFAGASWSEDGSIFVSVPFTKGGLLRIPAGEGQTETFAGLENGERALANPQVLPGGKAILLAAAKGADVDQYTIEVLTLADHHRKILARGGNSPHFVARSGSTGHLVYVNKATLFAIPFDLDKLETHGTAVPVLDDVAYTSTNGAGQFDFSRTGTLVYRRATGGRSAILAQWIDPSGKKEALGIKPGVYMDLSLSPDGKRVALTLNEGGSRDVWVYDQQRDAMTRLTFGGAAYVNPIWSPDGQHVVFSSLGNGIFQARADGASLPQALTQSNSTQIPFSFTPDGKWLAYMGTPGIQTWTVRLDEEGGQLKAGKPEQFIKSSFSDRYPRFSPDGRWLAYQSNESGKDEVYVRTFSPLLSGKGGKWQVSNNGGSMPHWSRTGHELIYQLGNQIMAASYTVKGDTFVADRPRVWIAKLGGTDWDLAPDGKRVAVLTPEGPEDAPQEQHHVVFLENFVDELQRRVPTGK